MQASNNNSNKPPAKAPEDLIYEAVDDYNRVKYLDVAAKEYIEANKGNAKVESVGLSEQEAE